VVRANGEAREGRIQGVAECLAHIGVFYHIGDQAPTPEEKEPRKTEGRRERRAYREWGMYAPEDMTVLREGRRE